jgi:hypothetical protein
LSLFLLFLRSSFFLNLKRAKNKGEMRNWKIKKKIVVSNMRETEGGREERESLDA